MKYRLLLCFLILLSYNGYGQSCTLNVSLSQSSTAICSGGSITLTASASGGIAPFAYGWSTGETTSSVNVNKPGTYTVSVSDKTPGCKPVIKNIIISVSSAPNAPTAKSVIACPNNSVTLTATAPGGVYQWYDAPVGGNFLASGATYTTPPILVSAYYYVETTLSGCTSPRTAVGVFLNSKPLGTSDYICAGTVANLSVSKGDSYTWYDAISGGNILTTSQIYTTPVLTTTTTYYVVVITNGCVNAPTAVTAYVTPFPQAPTASSAVVCSGSSADLHASGTSGVYNWYDTPSGGIPIISSPDYTTPTLTATTIYYVENSINQCVSPRTPVTVTVNPIPTAPVSQNTTVCYGTSATLTASTSTSGTCQWYHAAAGGPLLATGFTYTSPVLTGSTTYYVQANNGSCASTRTAVNVIVQTPLPIPTVSGAIICPGSVTTLTATGTGGIYSWYNAPKGGTLLITNTSFTTPVLMVNTTYYVESAVSGCTSARAAVVVTVLSQTAPVASNTSVCYGNSATLTALGSAINSYEWFDSPMGGNLLSTAQIYVTPNLTVATTYYVTAISVNGCNSSRTPVKVTVNPKIAPPTASGTTICPGASAHLIASSVIGIIKWYSAATGGSVLATGNTYNTPALTSTTTYYAESNETPCVSVRIPVTVTIKPQLSVQFHYPSGTYCTSSPNPSPTIYQPSGGTFTALPNGLVFISNTSGQINISATKPGKYKISFTSNGMCPYTTSVLLSVVTSTSSGFSYLGPYCQDGINPSPFFTGSASGGNFSATPSGLVFVDINTGEINLAASQFGNYIITNTIALSGSCAASAGTTPVTINERVTISAGTPQAVNAGSTVQLAGIIRGGITTGKWSGGTGSFSNPLLLNAVYTPGPGETLATLTLTSDDPPGVCGPKASTVTINFKANPSAPTASGTMACLNSNATITATAPGGTYEWYDAAINGNLLQSGAVYVTLPLTSNITYYVQTTINGVTSARTTVNVIVNPIPAAPIAPGMQTCIGSSVTLTASGSSGTYQWYDAATGGNLLSINNTFLTNALTVNTSYYVQTTVNGCISARKQADVTVTPVPNITSSATGNTCSGNALNYTITADIPIATFLWSRAQVAGISNPPLNNQTTRTINEILINTTGAPISVTYTLNPILGTCSGPAYNYVVTVYATPVVTSAPKATICNGTTANYAITFNTSGTSFNWSRAAVTGVSNATINGQGASIIREVLFNTTNAPIDVPYILDFKTSTCTTIPFNFVITVNPVTLITSSNKGTACSGYAQNYVITSSIPSSTFKWSRVSVPGISNADVVNQTSAIIDETLINTSINPVSVGYVIVPIANGCEGVPFRYNVLVNPAVFLPVANANSPVCVGSTIHLRTTSVFRATYLWTGPNGYSSALQNPDIENVSAANTGIYNLVVTVRGCDSPPASVTAQVNQPATALAGPDQFVCISVPYVLLAGNITGGSKTGIWSSLGTGTFLPLSNQLNAQYVPSDADRAAGSVILTLASTSTDDCSVSTSDMTIKFGQLPAANAGSDQTVCSQETNIKLNGKILISGSCIWSTSGTGTFSPSVSQLDASYVPSIADIKNGSIKITLLATGANTCYIATNDITITFSQPPTVNAGGKRYVLGGKTITLNPVVSNSNVQYLWSPNIDINDVTSKNPIITGNIDRTYTLTITDNLGCTATDQTFIKVSPVITLTNTFTPNGDGTNDLWNIKGLIAYQQATVDIFNRYGQKIYHSLGYSNPWDGNYNGQVLPVGVYYYIIDTKYNAQVLSGYVTLIR